MNLPIGAAAIAMVALFLPEHVQTRRHQVDYQGLVAAVAGDRRADAAVAEWRIFRRLPGGGRRRLRAGRDRAGAA